MTKEDANKPRVQKAPKGSICEGMIPFGLIPVPCCDDAEVRVIYDDILVVDYCLPCWEALCGLDVHEDHREEPEDIYEMRELVGDPFDVEEEED